MKSHALYGSTFAYSTLSMKKCPIIALCLMLLAASIAHGQGDSRTGVRDPFDIGQGRSFSASTAPRPAPRVEDPGVFSEGILADVREALDIIRTRHASGSKLDVNAVTKASINAMLSQLDPHSTYFDSNEFGQLLSDQNAEYSGTGSTISGFIRNSALETFVLSTHPDSSAANAGLLFGDRIVSVDGASVSGLQSDVIRDKVRGPRGSTVTLVLERAATGKVEKIVMQRERVFQSSVSGNFMLRDGVGYIGLTESFTMTTAAEFEIAMIELKRKGMKSLVLDLRGNSGGILDQAVRVAERFLPPGSSIISQRGRFSSEFWRSQNRDHETMPLVVLVDVHTASASEIVAGALQDNDRALIIGQNTFGKGLVQDVVKLPNGSGMTLTTARYYTPSGRSIQRSYAGTSLYDYFQHRQAAGAEQSADTRTLTNRPVVSGTGIVPDQAVAVEEMDAERSGLLDPIFFFVRQTVYEKRSGRAALSENERIRQSVIFNDKRMAEDLLPAFQEFALNNGWKLKSETLRRNESFIKRQLEYYLGLATFGPETANRLRVESDTAVLNAIEALPKAAALAELARKMGRPQASKKPPGRIPGGQGRNRRN